MAKQEKATRNRNPAFPAISLAGALDRARTLYDKEARKPMLYETAAKHWGYSTKSSGAQQALSALKQYGLLIELPGDKMRKIQLSDLALQIILDKREESSVRLEALREAAVNPRVYADLWRKAGQDGSLPSDTELEHYLLLERKKPFFEDAVKTVLRGFRATMSLAKRGECDILDIDKDAEEQKPGDVSLGCYVQWTSDGVMQFAEPRRVTGISDDRSYAFVEGSRTGIPVSELTIAEQPKPEMETPPPNPAYTPPLADIALSLPVIMDGGLVRNVDIPRMSEAAFKFFKDQLEIYRDAIVTINHSEPSEN